MSPTPVDVDTRREVVSDLASGAICVALAAGLAFFHFSQAGRLHDDFGSEPGPAMLPEILLATLALVGVGLALRGLTRLRNLRGLAPAGERAAPGLVVVLVAIALLAAFPPLRAWLGAAPALGALGAALGIIAGRKEGRAPLRAAIEGLLIAIFLYALFRFVLSVPLR